MSKTDTLHSNLARVWANLPGIGTLAAVNHTTIGLRFIVTGLFFFLVAGLLGMVMRTQLAQPEQDIITPEFYAQAFTMHGTLMMFLFAIPVLLILLAGGILIRRMRGRA